MRPFTVLIGILMGSAASLTFGLGSVLIVFCILAGEHPELRHELPQLVKSLLTFGALTARARVVSLDRPRGGRGAAGRMCDVRLPGGGRHTVLASSRVAHPRWGIPCELWELYRV